MNAFSAATVDNACSAATVDNECSAATVDNECSSAIVDNACSAATVDTSDPWSFYIIQNKGFTYAGVSPDPVRRLRQHNGELVGGAKYTTSKGPGWRHICLVHGFRTKIEAMQFEWAVKHVPPRDSGGIKNRLKKLFVVLNKPYWTSKASAAVNSPLVVEWTISESLLPLVAAERVTPPYVSQSFAPRSA